MTKRNSNWVSTEERIITSAYRLLNRKKCNFSVKDICEYAKISRPAFYDHYENLDLLLTKIKNEQINKIKTTYSNNNVKNDNEIFIDLLRYIKKHKTLFINVFSSYTSDFYTKDNFPLIEKYLRPLCAKEPEEGDDYSTQMLYYHTFYHSAIVNCILLWLKRDCPESERALSKYLFDCSNSELCILFKKSNISNNRQNNS